MRITKSINKAAQKNRQETFAELIKWFLYSVVICGIFYAGGYIYGFLKGETRGVDVSTWVDFAYQSITLHQWNNVLYLLDSILIPTIFVVIFKFTYAKWQFQAVKGLVLLIIGFLCWSWISGIVLTYLVTRHFEGSSLLTYFEAWRDPGLRIALHTKLLIAALIATFAMLLSSLFFIKSKKIDIYGDAHFGNLKEAKKAGLFAENGILLGKAFNKYLCMGGYEHVTLFAPTGTGKTTGLTIPNLLSWEDSCVVSDIKLELFNRTSAYRHKTGQQVYLWNPASPEGLTHCYNPLDMVSNNPHTRIDDIQKIAAIFIPDNPKIEPIWQVQSRFLFVGLVLYVLDTPTIQKTISEVVRLVKSAPNFSIFATEIIATRTDVDPLCRYNLMKFTELHEKTRLSILAAFLSYFELFDNPLIVAATARSDFDIRDLRKIKMTIYVGVTNDNLVRLSPLLTVFYQQVADALTRKVPEENEPYGVLFLMDEFSALRRMESFHKNIGLYREYKLRMVIIIQELSQLYDIYGRDGAKVFINGKIRIAYTQNDEETCKLIESMLGDKTLLIKNQSRKIDLGVMASPDRTESTTYIARPLMLDQEIRMLPDNKAIIVIQGHPPILANKIFWYSDKNFKEKALGAITIPSILKAVNTVERNIPMLTPNLGVIQEEELDQVV